MKATTREILDAIRSHELVGHGSCTVVDWCYSNRDIIRELERWRINTTEDAITWAVNKQSQHLEHGLNQRFGDNDDWQLVAWKKWQERIKGIEEL